MQRETSNRYHLSATRSLLNELRQRERRAEMARFYSEFFSFGDGNGRGGFFAGNSHVGPCDLLYSDDGVESPAQ